MLLGFIDSESTDIDPLTARITQYAISVYQDDPNDGWCEVWHYSGNLFDASYPLMNPVAQAITGIKRENLEVFGESPVDKMPDFLKAMAACDYVIGHNIRRFDIPLLEKECERYGFTMPTCKYIDTRFDLPYPDHIETRKLSYLCLEHKICTTNGHSARHDVDYTASLFFRYPIEEILKLASSPDVWLKAEVSYDDRDKAKNRKFRWDSVKKYWVKQVKECNVEKEKKEATFSISELANYEGN